MLYDTPNPTTGKEHFGGAQYALSNFGFDTEVTVYTGILALAANLIVVVVGSLVLRATRRARGRGRHEGRRLRGRPRGRRDPPVAGTPEQAASSTG